MMTSVSRTIATVHRRFQNLAGPPQVLPPRLRILRGQLELSQRLRQFAPRTGFSPVRYEPGNRGTILEQNKRHVLIMSAVHAVRKIAGGLGHRDDLLLHKIRLSDYAK